MPITSKKLNIVNINIFLQTQIASKRVKIFHFKYSYSCPIIKSISKVICDSLIRIINVYISIGIFPQSFKKATVTSIHKSGDTSLVHNFRPISTLPHISKVFERILYKIFCSYLSKNKILNDD